LSYCCSDTEQIKEQLEELQQQHQRVETDIKHQLIPSYAQQQRLQKIKCQIERAQAKMGAATAKLQEHQDLLQQLAAQEVQLKASADTAQQRFAADKVQAAADALLELSYAVAGLIRSTAGAVAPAAAATAAGWAGPAGLSVASGVAAHCQQLGLHMQLAEAVARADQTQQLDVNSQRQVETAVQQLQVCAASNTVVVLCDQGLMHCVLARQEANIRALVTAAQSTCKARKLFSSTCHVCIECQAVFAPAASQTFDVLSCCCVCARSFLNV
jgi:hypothetical protein